MLCAQKNRLRKCEACQGNDGAASAAAQTNDGGRPPRRESRCQRRMKGLGTSRSVEIHTHLVSRYSLIASAPDSRPMPERL